VQCLGAEAVAVNDPLTEASKAMEMILILGLCIITGAFIEQQYASMRRMKRVRVEENERQNY
jgi:hypothetical protein